MNALEAANKIREEYKLSPYKTIQDPGKFEGEYFIAPYLYDLMLNGAADDDDGESCTFFLDEDEKKAFELQEGNVAHLYEDSQGFVWVQID